MTITASQLRQIIKEEISRVLSEKKRKKEEHEPVPYLYNHGVGVYISFNPDENITAEGVDEILAGLNITPTNDPYAEIASDEEGSEIVFELEIDDWMKAEAYVTKHGIGTAEEPRR